MLSIGATMTDKELNLLISVYNALKYELEEYENVIHENSDQGYFQDMSALNAVELGQNSSDFNPDDKYLREVIVDNKVRLVSTNNPLEWIEKEFLGIVY